MLTRLRTALLWLMMLTIPVQGVAAAGMIYCGADHGHVVMNTGSLGSAGDAEALSIPGSASIYRAAQPEQAVHDHGSMDVTTTDADDSENHAAGGGAQKHSLTATCSACAVCCGAAALVSSFPVLPLLGALPAPIARVSKSPATVRIAGLRRPPRPFLV